MYAVITGDLVKSEIFIKNRREVLDILNTVLVELNTKWGDADLWVSNIYRGDSFQIVTNDAEQALRIALFIRAQLMQCDVTGISLEARVAVGIGDIEYLDRNSIASSDGEAFRLSGRSLEEIVAYRRLIIKTSNEALNQVLEVLSALIDAVSLRWSREQAAAISHWIFGATQVAMAETMDISQSAIQQRLQRAGHYALDTCLKHFKSILSNYKV